MKMPYLTAVRRTLAYRGRAALGMTIRPFKLRLGITERCNARCGMCNVWKQDPQRKLELTIEEYDKILGGNFPYLGRLGHVSVTGGEPTLRHDIVQIFETIHRHHPRASINLNSNGFMTDRIVGLIGETLDKGIALTVNISIDGLGELHDKMRGVEGASENAMATLTRLIDLSRARKGLKVGLNHVMTELNWRECEKVYAWCREHEISFNPIMPMTGELFSNEGQNFAFPEPVREELGSLFERMIAENDGKRLAYSEILRQLRGGGRDFRCWAGHIMLIIEEHGQVYPNGGCPKSWKLGNVREFDYDLKRLVQSEHAQGILSGVKSCTRCMLQCETLTTLKYPEALAAHRKLNGPLARPAPPPGERDLETARA